MRDGIGRAMALALAIGCGALSLRAGPLNALYPGLAVVFELVFSAAIAYLIVTSDNLPPLGRVFGVIAAVTLLFYQLAVDARSVPVAALFGVLTVGFALGVIATIVIERRSNNH